MPINLFTLTLTGCWPLCFTTGQWNMKASNAADGSSSWFFSACLFFVLVGVKFLSVRNDIVRLGSRVSRIAIDRMSVTTLCLICTHTQKHTHTYTHARARAWTRTHTHVCVCVCACVCVCVCVCVWKCFICNYCIGFILFCMLVCCFAWNESLVSVRGIELGIVHNFSDTLFLLCR